MKRICELFDTFSGNDLVLSYLNLNDDGIAYVSRTEKNNGITARIDEIENLKPFPSGTISVSLGGSVLEAFLHEEPFYTGYHIKVLKPKTHMSVSVLQFYCYCIRLNKFKYSFGRQANKTIDDILVPDLNEIPEWVEKERNIDINSIPEYFLDEGYENACWYLDNIDQETFEQKYKGKLVDEKVSLDVSNWHQFKMKEIFPIIERGKRQKSIDRISGEVPYYSASKNNNGLTDYISNPVFIDSNALICTTFGDAYYVEGDFTASDEITYFKSDNLNKYNALFISTIIKQEQFRYSFGRKAFKNKLIETKILLPSTLKEDKYIPDWDYMEKYIKSINYSNSI